mgnify:CR=1 FL=1
MLILINITITVATFLSMEFIAWFTHKYVMHGWLWFLHKDHHKPHNESFFEKNDYFFLIFAVPGITSIYFGWHNNFSSIFYVGLGITLYGFAYFLIHDLFIHQRIRVIRNTNNAYLKAIRRAHKVHHKHLGKEDGECFGMLNVPKKYFTTKRPS